MVFGQVAETLIRVEQQVLGPTVIDPVGGDGAHLEADRLVGIAADLAARAQRNERLYALGRLELLEHG